MTASNWGRWGDEDEAGALNLVDIASMRRGFECVRTGEIVDLSLPIRSTKVPRWPDRSPSMHFMTLDGGDYAIGARRPGGLEATDDYVFMACHGGTHIDAFAHILVDDQMYNGFPGSAVRSFGARQGGVDKMTGIVTRGVLLDLAGLKGVESLPAGQAITADELDACARAEGLEVLPGDAVLVRTGFLGELWRGADPRAGEPGLGMGTVDWIAAHDICAIGVDNNGVEVMPAEESGRHSPVHIAVVRGLGVPFIELVELDELARRGVYAFLLVVSPLKITGGTGSPVKPLAVI
jgi:kynurenine formamidase